MAYQAGGQRSVPRPVPESLEAQAYLQDYTTLLEAVPFPSVVLDHGWDVVLTNSAFGSLFRGVSPHPTAMPADNFLRFVLFHPDASTVLGEHESRWCLPMLAHFAAAVEQYGHDHGLQSIRRDIAQDPTCLLYTDSHRLPGRRRDAQDAGGPGVHPADAGTALGPPPGATGPTRGAPPPYDEPSQRGARPRGLTGTVGVQVVDGALSACPRVPPRAPACPRVPRVFPRVRFPSARNSVAAFPEWESCDIVLA